MTNTGKLMAQGSMHKCFSDSELGITSRRPQLYVILRTPSTSEALTHVLTNLTATHIIVLGRLCLHHWPLQAGCAWMHAGKGNLLSSVPILVNHKRALKV